jgi:CheY-like chemotaxis protein
MYRLAIVDDNETWCFVLALRLQQQGYAVSTFTNAQAFLPKVDQFDLVLVDFSIPTPLYQREMDGPEVICKVKHQLDNPPLLVLVSSFFTEDVLNDRAKICPEADAILSKQTETTELFSQIQKLLENRTSLSQKRYYSHLAEDSSSEKSTQKANRQSEAFQGYSSREGRLSMTQNRKR